MAVVIGRAIGSDWIDVIVKDFYFVVVQDDFLNQCIDHELRLLPDSMFKKFYDLFALDLILLFVLLSKNFIFNFCKLLFCLLYSGFGRWGENTLFYRLHNIVYDALRFFLLCKKNIQHGLAFIALFVYLHDGIGNQVDIFRRTDHLTSNLYDELFQIIFSVNTLIATAIFFSSAAFVVMTSGTISGGTCFSLNISPAVSADTFTCLRKWTI